MNGNPPAILTGALLAAGTAGIQAVLTALGSGPAGIVTSVAALLTTAITVLGPKLIDLRAQQQFGKDIRWLMTHKQDEINPVEMATLLKDYHEKVLQAHVAAIKAAHTEAKERSTGPLGQHRCTALRPAGKLSRVFLDLSLRRRAAPCPIRTPASADCDAS
jgi:hypothetical protein